MEYDKRPQQRLDEDEKSLKEKDYDHIQRIRVQKGGGYHDQLQVFMVVNGRRLMKQIHYGENLSDGFDRKEYKQYDVEGCIRFQDVTEEQAVARYPHFPVDGDLLTCNTCHNTHTNTERLGEKCSVCEEGKVLLWESKLNIPEKIMEKGRSVKERGIIKNRWMTHSKNGEKNVKEETLENLGEYRTEYERIRKSRMEEDKK